MTTLDDPPLRVPNVEEDNSISPLASHTPAMAEADVKSESLEIEHVELAQSSDIMEAVEIDVPTPSLWKSSLESPSAIAATFKSEAMELPSSSRTGSDASTGSFKSADDGEDDVVVELADEVQVGKSLADELAAAGAASETVANDSASRTKTLDEVEKLSTCVEPEPSPATIGGALMTFSPTSSPSESLDANDSTVVLRSPLSTSHSPSEPLFAPPTNASTDTLTLSPSLPTNDTDALKVLEEGMGDWQIVNDSERLDSGSDEESNGFQWGVSISTIDSLDDEETSRRKKSQARAKKQKEESRVKGVMSPSFTFPAAKPRSATLNACPSPGTVSDQLRSSPSAEVAVEGSRPITSAMLLSPSQSTSDDGSQFLSIPMKASDSSPSTPTYKSSPSTPRTPQTPRSPMTPSTSITRQSTLPNSASARPKLSDQGRAATSPNARVSKNENKEKEGKSKLSRPFSIFQRKAAAHDVKPGISEELLRVPNLTGVVLPRSPTPREARGSIYQGSSMPRSPNAATTPLPPVPVLPVNLAAMTPSRSSTAGPDPFTRIFEQKWKKQTSHRRLPCWLNASPDAHP